MDFLLKIGIRGNPLTVEVFSFQVLSFYCQSFSFGLEIIEFTLLIEVEKYPSASIGPIPSRLSLLRRGNNSGNPLDHVVIRTCNPE